MKKNEEKVTNYELSNNPDVYDFTVYCEIYDNKEMICKVFANFIGDVEELTAEDIHDITTFLEIKSLVPRKNISHTVIRIANDIDLYELISRIFKKVCKLFLPTY